MSLSDKNKDSGHRGRIIAGYDAGSLEENLVSRDKPFVWTEDKENELLARIRDKARAHAKDIIARAMEEAHRVKKEAKSKGYSEALQQAKEEHCRSVAQVLEAFQNEKEKIWNQHREDMLQLLRMVVEKVVRVEIDEQREQSLSKLLEESLERIDSHLELTVTVHPRDGELIKELLVSAKKKFPALAKCRVKTQDGMERGGVVLESSFGKVDNSVSSRLESIHAVLDQISYTNGTE